MLCGPDRVGPPRAVVVVPSPDGFSSDDGDATRRVRAGSAAAGENGVAEPFTTPLSDCRPTV
ncbi:hypothetical protein C2R22_16905 [Salinigranum rubrum]|uniref:Uncharacterized protein n=1 Tax=Salinigranum rubrum TaxID=755307 RepID=A0A2I8VMH8_9EURY|nr:hypothetical protein C2R22_16905 [Salinigranum rubrum]